MHTGNGFMPSGTAGWRKNRNMMVKKYMKIQESENDFSIEEEDLIFPDEYTVGFAG